MDISGWSKDSLQTRITIKHSFANLRHFLWYLYRLDRIARENALSPMDVIESGIVIYFKPMQSAKASSLMGFDFEHLRNACSGTDVTSSNSTADSMSNRRQYHGASSPSAASF